MKRISKITLCKNKNKSEYRDFFFHHFWCKIFPPQSSYKHSSTLSVLSLITQDICEIFPSDAIHENIRIALISCQRRISSFWANIEHGMERNVRIQKSPTQNTRRLWVFLSPIILISRRDDLISDVPPVIHEVVTLCSWYNPFHFPSLFVQVSVVPNSKTDHVLPLKFRKNFLSDLNFNQSGEWGLGKQSLARRLVR